MWVRPTQVPDDDVQVFYLGMRAAVSHVGAVLGERYELREVLGCGGTAAVYRALDRRTKAAVAVKVLHAGARETIGPFFQQEGRLTARIASPHIVRAHDFGEDDGRPFIVFDLVPGEALSSMFYGEVMPWRDLGLVVLHVLDGLAALHRLGIVHRDVKPQSGLMSQVPKTTQFSRLRGGDVPSLYQAEGPVKREYALGTSTPRLSRRSSWTSPVAEAPDCLVVLTAPELWGLADTTCMALECSYPDAF